MGHKVSAYKKFNCKNNKLSLTGSVPSSCFLETVLFLKCWSWHQLVTLDHVTNLHYYQISPWLPGQISAKICAWLWKLQFSQLLFFQWFFSGPLSIGLWWLILVQVFWLHLLDLLILCKLSPAVHLMPPSSTHHHRTLLQTSEVAAVHHKMSRIN